MAKFQIDILGCGSATPSVRHNPSGQIINFRDRLMMVDCGEGSQLAMRRMGIGFNRLEHIFISHLHGDHCLGLPGLLSTMALHDKGGRIRLTLPQDGLDRMRDIISLFCPDSPFEIEYQGVGNEPCTVADDHAMTVEAFQLKHRVPCLGYIFREKPKPRHLRGDMIRFFGIPIADLHAIKQGADWTAPDGRVIANERLTTAPDPSVSYAYCSDTMFSPAVAEAVKGVDVIYHEATYDDSLAEQARRRGHSTAREAGKIARMAGAKRLIIGHYSNRYTSTELLLRQAREEFENVTAADEGMKIDLL